MFNNRASMGSFASLVPIMCFACTDVVEKDFAAPPADVALSTSPLMRVLRCPPWANVIVGTEDDDHIIGTHRADCIFGLGGDDHIEGGNGHDIIFGGPGNDILLGDKGRDLLYGEDGIDIIDGGNGGDSVFGGSGNDVIIGAEYKDSEDGGDGYDVCSASGRDCEQVEVSSCDSDSQCPARQRCLVGVCIGCLSDAACAELNELCLPTVGCAASLCRDGFADCDGNAENGCEGVLSNDVGNCGYCGHRCVVGASCVAGQCSQPSVVEIVGGTQYTCARLANGTAACWGSNGTGELGNGMNVDASTPQVVIGLTESTSISAQDRHTCAVLRDGTVKCWGENYFGELGNQTTIDSSIPVAVSGLTDAVAVAAGGGFTCALLLDQTVKCWGYNGEGELGNGTTTNSLVPVTVSGLADVIAISAGIQHTCALLKRGTVACWGAGKWYGQLGNGTMEDAATPVPVSGLSNVTAISMGGHHGCALLADEGVECWGWNIYGQLGNGSAGSPLTTPTTVSNLGTVKSVSGAFDYTCARKADGSVVCWGANDDGQLGNGTTANSAIPLQVVGLDSSEAVLIGSGGSCTCATLASGTTMCWGGDWNGQLGNGTVINSAPPYGSTIPVAVKW